MQLQYPKSEKIQKSTNSDLRIITENHFFDKVSNQPSTTATKKFGRFNGGKITVNASKQT